MKNKTNMFLVRLAIYLEEYRMRNEIRQSEFSAQLGFSLATYRRIITEPTKFGAGMAFGYIERFAALEGYSLAEFFAMFDSQFQRAGLELTETEKITLEMLQKAMTPEEMQGILAAAGQLGMEQMEPFAERWFYKMNLLLLNLTVEDRYAVEKLALEKLLSFAKDNTVNEKKLEPFQKRFLTLTRKELKSFNLLECLGH